MGGVGKVRSKSSRLDATRDVNLILQWKPLRWSNRHNACEKCGVSLFHGVSQPSFKTWIIGEMIREIIPRIRDRNLPGTAAPRRLEAPLEQVQQQHIQPADKVALFAASHTVDFR